MTSEQIRRWYNKGKANRYAWPGGYPLYYVTTDGAALCADCLTKNRALIVRATFEWGNRSKQGGTRVTCGWAISGQDVNWEDASLYCDNCNKRIESAYAEDEAVSK